MQTELTHAVLRWHAAHLKRLAIGKEKRRIDAQIRAGGDGAWCLQRSLQQSDTAHQLTQAKRKELAALRELAKACAKQRDRLDLAEVIDQDGAIELRRFE